MRRRSPLNHFLFLAPRFFFFFFPSPFAPKAFFLFVAKKSQSLIDVGDKKKNTAERENEADLDKKWNGVYNEQVQIFAPSN